MSVEHLFVYGTLQPGRENAHLLERIGGTWRAASVIGVLRPADKAAGFPFPALKLDANGTEVRGYVFSSERLAEHWRSLDEFEAEDDYERVVTRASLEDGSTVETYVYVLDWSSP